MVLSNNVKKHFRQLNTYILSFLIILSKLHPFSEKVNSKRNKSHRDMNINISVDQAGLFSGKDAKPENE